MLYPKFLPYPDPKHPIIKLIWKPAAHLVNTMQCYTLRLQTHFHRAGIESHTLFCITLNTLDLWGIHACRFISDKSLESMDTAPTNCKPSRQIRSNRNINALVYDLTFNILSDTTFNILSSERVARGIVAIGLDHPWGRGSIRKFPPLGPL